MADLLKRLVDMKETGSAIQKDFQKLKESLQIEIERGHQLAAERRELKVLLQTAELARDMATEKCEQLEEENANLTGELNTARRKVDALEKESIGQKERLNNLRNSNIELRGKFEGALQAVERLRIAS